MASGALSLADAADGLTRTQRFLDRRLNRRYDHAERTWLNFPPADVEQLMDVHFPQALDNHRRLTSRRSFDDVTAVVRCFSIYAPVRRAHDRCSRWG
jgi:hypothetical protein